MNVRQDQVSCGMQWQVSSCCIIATDEIGRRSWYLDEASAVSFMLKPFPDTRLC